MLFTTSGWVVADETTTGVSYGFGASATRAFWVSGVSTFAYSLIKN